MAARILIVDDEIPVLELLVELLADRGFHVDGVPDGKQALEMFNSKSYDLAVVDLIMPGISGLEVIRRIKALDEDVEVVVLTGYATIDNAVQALGNYKAFDFLTKPLENLDILYNTIEKALERRELQGQNRVLVEAVKQAGDEFEKKAKARIVALEKENQILRKKLDELQASEDNYHMAAEIAEEASRVKSDFFANMSHDFKNPLTTILGFSQVLLEKYYGPLTEKQEKYIKDIHQGGERLLTLIDDLLDITSLDNENEVVKLSHVNVKEMIDSSLSFLRQKALQHGLHLTLSKADDSFRLNLKADKRKIKLVLFQLIISAMKSTPDGGEIKLETKRLTEENKEFMEISIVCSGDGFEKRDRSEVKEDVFMHDSSGNPNPAGREIVPSLVKNIAKLHGGSISIESDAEQKGRRLSLVLPLENPEPHSLVPKPEKI